MTDAVTVRCPACGALNRVPANKLGQGLAPICGRCKTPLPIDSKPLLVTDSNFAAEVESSPLPVLLDLWAPWCGPCRMIAPIVDQLTLELAGRVRVGKLNVDENPRTADRFQVRGIPALLLLKAGREIDRIVGVQPKQEIVKSLERALAQP
jgi:thioredoxin 2